MNKDQSAPRRSHSLRKIVSVSVEPVITVLCVLLLLIVPSLLAAHQRPLHVVVNDRGGVISDRIQEIRRIIRQGKRIEIRGGGRCLSSCTMYLGAPDVCVTPAAKFGFHGPSNHGRSLPPEQFEYWSRIIASYYPKPLARWYMRTGRHLQEGYYFMTGAQLISLGVKKC